MKVKKVDLTDTAKRILESRYLLKDSQGKVVESPEEMFVRVSKAIAEVENEYGATREEVEELEEKFYDLMTSFKFLPNSPTLMNAGTPMGQLSACFVLPVEDSMEGIFETLKNAAIIHKTGGGTGFSFSRLRPKGDIVRSTGGVASGPVSFMKVFNAATEAVKQGGRRRGANMGMLRVDHPDIIEFITCKDNVNELTNFNISVSVTDIFMEAVIKDEEYELINPRTGSPDGRLRARKVFELMVNQAWKNGEPGVIFIDRINKTHTVRGLGEIEATNPCGEKPLLPYESCNLGSINLAKFFKGTPFYLEETRAATFDEVKDKIDWKALRETVFLSVHFLDNVIDANSFPLPQIERMTKLTRKIGLGVMGFADLLYMLGIPYRSEEALKAARYIMKFIQDSAHEASCKLGERKGSFPAIDKSIFKGTTRRNAVVTTIAPTGTISMIADTSSGIEPNFSLVYVKNVMGGEKFLFVNKYLKEAAIERGFYTDELIEKLSNARSIKSFKEVPEYIREIFDTTFDISPEQHVRMQAAFQDHVEDAVSKTINLPNEATPEDVEKVYLLAYELGVKGITVYRDGSRPGQVLDLASKKSKSEENKMEEEVRRKPGTLSPRARPLITKGKTFKMQTEMGSLYVTINEDDVGLLEVFVHLGKSGSSSMAFTEAIGRLISLALRSGVSPTAIIKQLKGIKSSTPVRQENGEVVFSVPDAIAKALEKYIHGGEQLELLASKRPLSFIVTQGEEDKNGAGESRAGDVCPECGGVLVFMEGCYVCRDCGYSKCE